MLRDEGSVVAALDAFRHEVVEPLEAEHHDDLFDPRRRYDVDGVYSEVVLSLKRRVRTAAATRGIYAAFVPEELGGGGLGAELHYAAWRHLYRSAGPDRLLPYDAMAHPAGGPTAVLLGVADAWRDTVVPALMSGEHLLCSAFTEGFEAPQPTATTATRDGDSWWVAGTKHRVSRAPYATYVLVYALVDGAGLTAFLLPKDLDGLRVGPVVPMFGRTGGEEVHVTFDAVSAADHHVVGTVGGGGAVSRSMADAATAFTAGRFIGLAEWLIAMATRQMRAGGRAPADRDDRLVALGRSCAAVHAADATARAWARATDSGVHVAAQSSIVRALAPEMCRGVYDACMPIVGSLALTSAARAFDGWHQAQILASAGYGANASFADIGRTVVADMSGS